MSEQAVIRSEPPPGKGVALAVYILYLVGMVIPFTGLVGLVMAYVNRGKAPDWVRSHFRFQIRTFWIALLYGVVSIVLVKVVVGILLGLFTVVWLIVRCVKGMICLGDGNAYPKPASWLW
ncbi:MAG TPA: DUF4870 domain-containing protein [Rhizomicrobium sp.]|nr:DUF4870 domain-containing protein [Rhizomicrobium sp.]